MRLLRFPLLCLFALSFVSAWAQEVPREYQQVLDYLGRKGDFKDGVLKVNVPSNDLSQCRSVKRKYCRRKETCYKARSRRRFEPVLLATIRAPLFITTSTRAES